MRNVIKYLSLLYMALSSICAQANVCDAVAPDKDERGAINQRENPLAIPSGLEDIVSTDQIRLKVKTRNGNIYCFRAAWIQRLDDIELLQDGRFLGFHYYALEADGYILIDRAGDGAEIATGNKPYFMDDGKSFIALQVSGAGWGNLEGLAAWRVKKDATERSFFTDTHLRDGSYKISHFDGSGCGYIKTEFQHSGMTVPSYILFELGNGLLFSDDNNLEKCISRKTGRTVLDIRKSRPASKRGPTDWYAIQDGDDPVDSGRPYNLYFADKGSIFGSAPYLSMVTSELSILEKPASKYGMEITEYRKRSLMDCEQMKYQTLDFAEYGHDGNLIMSNKFLSDSVEWIDAHPGTAAMAMITIACEPDSKIGEQRWPGYMEPRELMKAMAQADWSK